jgi:hypothetical protein
LRDEASESLRKRTGNLIRDSRELIPGFGPEQGISLKIDSLTVMKRLFRAVA